MKRFLGFLGSLGALAAVFMGLRWRSELGSEMTQKVQALVGPSGEMGQELSSMKTATTLLLVCGLLGLVISVLILMRKGNRWAHAAVLILAGILPMFFSSNALFGLPMTLAGIFALAVKYDAAAPTQSAS